MGARDHLQQTKTGGDDGGDADDAYQEHPYEDDLFTNAAGDFNADTDVCGGG